MPYQLAIDLGTTYTAAAVRRSGEAEPEVVQLGNRTMAVPSVVFLAEDGSLVVGEAAERRAVTDPDRVVREFKQRIGDGIPLLVGGESVSAHDLAARVARWVVDRVAEREGENPSGVAVTHPAGWGPHKTELFAGALAAAGLADAEFEVEPQAAAAAYASSQRVEPGATIGVYDLGGGTFDAAVVRKTTEGGFELLGRPEGVERLGGQDFDEAVFEHVRAAVGDAWDGLDVTDPAVLAALGRLREECREAKEALSADTEVTIPVMVPGAADQVRLVRAEFEEMIRPSLEETVEALERTITSAGLVAGDLSAVLLIGGSSRIPLVAEMVSARLDRPVAVDADPKTTVALGAALAAGHWLAEEAASPLAAAVPPPEISPEERTRSSEESSADGELDGVYSPARPAVEPSPMQAGEERPFRRRLRTVTLATSGGVVTLAAVIALAVTAADGSRSGDRVAAGESPRATQTDRSGATRGGAAVDPWTGQPATLTTAPGPSRRGARPVADSIGASGIPPTGIRDDGQSSSSGGSGDRTFSDHSSNSPSPDGDTSGSGGDTGGGDTGGGGTGGDTGGDTSGGDTGGDPGGDTGGGGTGGDTGGGGTGGDTGGDTSGGDTGDQTHIGGGDSGSESGGSGGGTASPTPDASQSSSP